MKDTKARLTVVSLIIFTVVMMWYFIDILTPLGTTAAAIPNAEDAWGFQWAAENLGWLLFFTILAGGVFILVKGRRKG